MPRIAKATAAFSRTSKKHACRVFSRIAKARLLRFLARVKKQKIIRSNQFTTGAKYGKIISYVVKAERFSSPSFVFVNLISKE